MAEVSARSSSVKSCQLYVSDFLRTQRGNEEGILGSCPVRTNNADSDLCTSKGVVRRQTTRTIIGADVFLCLRQKQVCVQGW